MRWCFMFCGALCFLVISTYGHPFLLSQGSSLPSIFGAGSSPTPESNIADLRKQKSSKIRENLKLNEEDDDFFKESEEHEDPNEEEEGNIVLPSLLQKKIGKILNKLQFISAIRGNADRTPPNNENKTNSENDFDKEFNDFDNNESENVNLTQKIDENMVKNNVLLYVRKPVEVTNKKLEYEEINNDELRQNKDENVKGIIIVANTKNNNKTNDTKERVKKSEKLKNDLAVNTPNFVIYVMELIGTAFGLAYGAVAQITNRQNEN